MNKYSPCNSSRSQLKSRMPRIKNLHFFGTGTPSPTSSRNTSFTQSSFTIAPLNRPIKIPRLNTKTVLSSKNKSVERNIGDLEYFEDYKKAEIKKSRRVHCSQFPFWFMESFNDTDSKEDIFGLFTDKNRDGLHAWIKEMVAQESVIFIN